jgi:hypothetical protein
MDESAEPITPEQGAWSFRGWIGAGDGGALVEGPVRAVGTVVIDVFVEDEPQSIPVTAPPQPSPPPESGSRHRELTDSSFAHRYGRFLSSALAVSIVTTSISIGPAHI